MTRVCVFCNGAKCEECNFTGTQRYDGYDKDNMKYQVLRHGQYVTKIVGRDFFVQKTGDVSCRAFI